MKQLGRIIPIVFMVIFVFYYTYPQALSIGGSSFVSVTGIMGLALYVYHRLPFKEVVYVIAVLLTMYLWFYGIAWINDYYDAFTFGYIKSHLAWFFSAYLVIFCLFKVHKNLSLNTVLVYISVAVFLQAFITFIMYLNQDIQDFFVSLQMQIQYTDELIEAAEKERLVGYGIALFGAGAMSGVGLIAMSYLLMRAPLNKTRFAILAIAYTFTFYIGLFMARTTIVGMVTGLGLILILYVLDHKQDVKITRQSIAAKKQANIFFVALGFLFVVGYFLAYIYFPSFTDWAFELFNNLSKSGKLQTRSSSGLSEMFFFPDDLHTLFFGHGGMSFWGSDVGYTRLVFFAGIPGMLIFFIYQMAVIKYSLTRDWSANLLLISMFIFCLLLNIKGLMDLNFFTYLIFFYFMFYKYYVYMPKVYLKQRDFLLQRKQQDNF